MVKLLHRSIEGNSNQFVPLAGRFAVTNSVCAISDHVLSVAVATKDDRVRERAKAVTGAVQVCNSNWRLLWTLELVRRWIDTVPLSRSKRNIARDFSDGGNSLLYSDYK